MRWRAWYSDGANIRVYASDRWRWQDLPSSGLQVVKVYDEVEWKPGHPYTMMLDGCDWYYRTDGRIEGVKSTGWDGHRPKPSEDAKRGTGVPDEVFAQITELAMAAKCL